MLSKKVAERAGSAQRVGSILIKSISILPRDSDVEDASMGRDKGGMCGSSFPAADTRI